MAAIFFFSSQSAEESGGLSGSVVRWIMEPLWRWFAPAGAELPETLLFALEVVLRKCAHLFVFFVFGFCVANTVRQATGDIRRVFWVSLGWCSAYAAFDELHQLFVPGRSGMWLDWLIDTAGALLGIGLVFLILRRKGWGLSHVRRKRGFVSLDLLPLCSENELRRKGKLLLLCLIEILFAFSLAVIFTNRYLVLNWDTLNTAEILFHLSVPLRGAGADKVMLLFRDCVLPVALIMVLVNLLLFARYKKRVVASVRLPKKEIVWTLFPLRYSHFLIASALLLVCGVIMTNNNFDFRFVYRQLADPSTFIEENYVDPEDVSISFPAEKRNLIFIFVESLETTYLSKELGGALPVNLIPEVTQVMRDNVTFDREGIFWGAYDLTSSYTIASLVSQTSGLPLFAIPGNVSVRNGKFLPNASSLGKILEENGYTNTFMIGSDAAFAGRDIYFSTHGNYRVLDLMCARANGLIPRDYHVWWGFEDKILYEWAKEEALRLSEEPAPFNLTLLTVDSHFGGGYVCDLCIDEHADQYSNVISCASRQVSDFVKWAQQQTFFGDTTIIVAGDHTSMEPLYFDGLDSSYERKTIVTFINPAVLPINTDNRLFSLFDMFPSTLAALGADIPGNRLALGVNLFSGEPTIIEEFSRDIVVSELEKLSKFYNESFW